MMNTSRSSKKIDENYNTLLGEYNVLKCKWESKCEAVLILSQELTQCQGERDQFKLMADQLRERYSTLKRQVEGWGPSLMGVYDVRGLKGDREKSLAMLLCELKEQNRTMQSELDDFKQKLGDAQGDVKVLRDQLARQRSDSLGEITLTRTLPAFDQEALVKQLETVQQKYSLLERDLESILDEKEELVTARDAYKHKVERLNQQLNNVLRGDDAKLIDIDSVLMENRYLNERLKQTQDEMKMLMTNLSKYKTLLEKKRSGRGAIRLTTSAGTFVLSNKHVQQILHTNPLLELPNNPSSPADLRVLIMALFETLNDKSLALSHQKKANKILGNRVTDLENRLKTMEDSGCWTPRKMMKPGAVLSRSESSPAGGSTSSIVSERSLTGLPPRLTGTSDVPEETSAEERELDNDLDLLPTKEASISVSHSRSSSVSHSESETNNSHPGSPLLKSHFHLKTSSTPDLVSGETVQEDTAESFELPSGSKGIVVGCQSEDEEELPPQLQKLLTAALADMEKLTAPPLQDPDC